MDLDTINDIVSNAQEEVGNHTPGSLSPVSWAWPASTPPAEVEDAGSLAADPLDITCPISPEHLADAPIPGEPPIPAEPLFPAEPLIPAESPAPAEPPALVEPTDQAPDIVVPQVSLPPSQTPSPATQSVGERFHNTQGGTQTTLGPSELPASQPLPVGRGKRVWGTCKKCVEKLGCCFASSG